MSPEEEEPEVTCPVCGNPVGIDDEFCPHCGAEFEEEKVEEIIEVEEEYPEAPEEMPEEEYEEAAPEEEVAEKVPAAVGLFDMRVFGIALLILGFLGAFIAIQIEWLWTWVPPIDGNIGLFALVGLAIIVIGFLGFTWIRKAVSEGKKVPRLMPSVLLGIFIFGIIALIMIVANGPINDAMGSSQGGMIGVFAVLFIVGVLLFIMGQKRSATA